MAFKITAIVTALSLLLISCEDSKSIAQSNNLTPVINEKSNCYNCDLPIQKIYNFCYEGDAYIMFLMLDNTGSVIKRTDNNGRSVKCWEISNND